jgi:hypothetical protein
VVTGYCRVRLQPREHGNQRNLRVPASSARARTAAAATGPAPTDRPRPTGRGRRHGGRARSAHRRDHLRMVRWTDHPTQPRTDPEVVLGHLPAPSLGTDPRRGLRPGRGAGGRATGRNPCPPPADPPGLAEAARRAVPTAGRRPSLRPRPARPWPSAGAGTAGLPMASPSNRRSRPVLSQTSSTSSVAGHG